MSPHKPGPPRGRPRPKLRDQEVGTDDDRETAFICGIVQAFKSRLAVGEIRKDFFCPLCGSPIVIAREKSRGAVRVYCTGKGCLRCLE